MVVERAGRAVGLDVAAPGGVGGQVLGRADRAVELVGEEPLDIGALGDVEPAAGLERVGAIVLGRVLLVEGGKPAAAQLHGVPAPVRDQAQGAARLEGAVGVGRRAAEDVVGEDGAELGLREQHEAADADAGGDIGLDAEELDRAPVGERIGLDLEEVGVVAGGRTLEGGDLLRRPGIGAPVGIAVEHGPRLLHLDDAVAGTIDLGPHGHVAVAGCGRHRGAAVLGLRRLLFLARRPGAAGAGRRGAPPRPGAPPWAAGPARAA